MKVRRLKKANKILAHYRHHFDYSPPYLILTDGTFCQAALAVRSLLRPHHSHHRHRQHLHSPLLRTRSICGNSCPSISARTLSSRPPSACSVNWRGSARNSTAPW